MHLYQSLNRQFSLYRQKCFQTQTFFVTIDHHRQITGDLKKTPWKKYTLLLHKDFVCPRDLELVPWTCFFQSSRLWSEGQQQWTPFLTGITLKEKWESVPKYFYETNKINPTKHLNINQYWGIENNFNWSRFALFFNDPLN